MEEIRNEKDQAKDIPDQWASRQKNKILQSEITGDVHAEFYNSL
jgi:hypothetical protein